MPRMTATFPGNLGGARIIPLLCCLLVGCTARTYTFQVVDADTHKPMKGVKIGHRDLRTMPNDSEKVIFFVEVWHPFPTGDDGIFKCTLDTGWWHVLHFCPPDCAAESDTGHLDAFATVSPAPIVVRIGDWPKEGEVHAADGVILVELETFEHRGEKIKSEARAATKPATKPATKGSSN
jgi:hypothetical protein